MQQKEFSMPPVEEKTIQTIEAALADLGKNKATKNEVITLIDEKVAEDKAILKALGENTTVIKGQLDDAVTEVGSLKKQLRAVMASGLADPSVKGPLGCFKSYSEAKAFGLLLMAGATIGTSMGERHAKSAIKALKEMGIEPRFTDENFKAMTGSSQTAGGALLTSETSPSFIMLLEQYGLFRRYAANVPMGAAETIMPKVTGLLTSYVPGEGGSVTSSTPTIPAVTLTPKTINYLTAYSMELDEDSAVGLAMLLAPIFARSMAYDEDRIGFLGDGTSTYFGYTGITGALFNVDATIGNIKGIVVGSGNAYSELVIGDFQKVVGTPLDSLDAALRWFVHRYFYYTVMVRVALTSSTAASEILLGQATKQKQFLGYPVDFAQVMPKAEANSQICSIFGDLGSGAMLGTRGQVQFASSSERYFDQGLIGLRGRNRIAFNVHGVGDTTAASAIVGLATAAS
jgi:HK97 family phage major capsid protein